MDNLNDMFIIETNDNKIINVDRKISNVIEYFKTSSKFENVNTIKFDSLNHEQFLKLLNFCQIINYTPLELEESFCNPKKEYEKFPTKLKDFYENLSEKDLNDFMVVSVDLIIPCLEEICLMKVNGSLNDNKFFEDITKLTNINKNDLINELLNEDDKDLTEEELNDMKIALELCNNKEFNTINMKKNKQ